MPNRICSPVPDGEVVTANAATWRYNDGQPLTIDKVTLNGGDNGAELVTSVLVPSPVGPDGSSSGIGAMIGFPPKIPPEITQRWDKRFVADGANYPASPTPLQLFVVLKRLASTVETTSVSVDYHRGSEQFSMTIPVGYILVSDEDGCQLPDDTTGS